ncbi:Aldehyde/histidinol dehydrogenase [Aspergillus nidulans var. acristatus]
MAAVRVAVLGWPKAEVPSTNGSGKSVETRLFINGEFQPSSDGKTFSLIDPFTQKSVAEGSFPGSLKKAQAMPLQPPKQHSRQGTSSLNTPGYLNMTVKQPYGVVACIIPWNVPMAFLAFKSALAATLIAKAGFPPDVVNILSGFGIPAGSTLASHMDVRCLSFTGSSFTGQRIQAAAAASNMKIVHMELGGKSPALIFDDADLENAAQATQFSIQCLSGQTCMANSRIYVQESVADKFLALFKEKFGSAVLVNPLESGITHGPQVDELQYERVKSYITIGEQDGNLSMGGDAGNGYFIKPTVFESVPEDSRIMKEEVFGPVVVINTFRTEEEAIKKANASEFGLYASVFTNDLDRVAYIEAPGSWHCWRQHYKS